MLLGLFAVNALHNGVHLAFGVWGLAAGRSAAGATSFLKAAGIIYVALTVLGFVAPDGFGLVPLGGNDRWLHLALAVVMTYFGFMGGSEKA